MGELKPLQCEQILAKTSPTRRDMTTKALSSIECEPTENRLCIRGRSLRRVSSEHFIVEISRLFAALHETGFGTMCGCRDVRLYGEY
jgi:hypothetical protein